MSKFMPRLAIVPFAILFLTVAVTSVSSQTSTATLNGTVIDTNGAAIAGAAVTINDNTKGFQRSAVTNDDGGFGFPLLQPSNYTLTVARSGFASAEVQNIILNVADQKAIKI